MNGWPETEFSIGLRHVLEDSLALLSGTEVQSGRKDAVLKDVCNFMEQARKGSEVTTTAAFIASAQHASDVEAYALLFHHLDSNFKDDLGAKIRTTAEVMSKLCNNEVVSEKTKVVAEELLGNLLNSLSHERALSSYVLMEASAA